ncbi:hypothetical protein M1D96_06310 [Pseudomonas sp. D1-3]
MATVTREHLAGLEMALCHLYIHMAPENAKALEKLIAQASAAPEQEAVAWIYERYISSNQYSARRLSFDKPYSTDRNIQPLYTHPSAEIERLRAENEKWASDFFKAVKSGADIEQKLADAQALLQRTHRDLDACQKVIWLAGVGTRGYGFHPAYCEDAQARLTEIDAFLSATAQPAEVKPTVPECPPGHELVALPIDTDDSRPSGPCKDAMQAMTMLDFGLSFALCNRDHGGTRRDVKKAQKYLEELKAFLTNPAEDQNDE